MDNYKIIELFSYSLPALITGAVAYYFFKIHTQNEQDRRNYLLKKEAQKELLPIRLQAYERMVIYLERINPSSLLVRSIPNSENKFDYENFLVSQIEQEYIHNQAQQIYVSEKCWFIITTAKNAIIQNIRNASGNDEIESAQKLRETILNHLMTQQSPSNAALAFLKNEVATLW